MKNIHGWLVTLLLTLLMTVFLAGCGNSGGETTPVPAQTGDVTAFPNKALLASAETITAPETIVLDARRSVNEYNAGHIPGAIFAPPSHFEKNGVLLSPDEIATILGGMGITRDSKIIIYDNTTASRGAAGRLFWILEYLGCTDVTILNGGWDQWQAQDMPITTEVSTPLSPAIFTAQPNPTVLVVTKETLASQLPPGTNFIVLDVRTDAEYQGTQPNSTDPRLGHIPGALNFPYSQCFNPDKSVLNFNDLKRLLETYGVTQDKVVVAYSTVGHRSGFFYYLCRLMGYTHVSNYVGSIVDWGNAGLVDPVMYPMETGQ